MLLKSKLFILFLTGILFIGCKSSNNDIYVSVAGSDSNSGTKDSPVQTITQALKIAKSIKTKSNNSITIMVKSGDYHLTEPLVITPELNDLSIVGEFKGQVKIKGSKVIATHWKRFDENIWVTDLTDDIDFNQLFVNGEKQILARFPNYDENEKYWQGYSADATSKERIMSWKNPVGGFIHGMHSGRWGGFHYQITNVTEDGELNLSGGHQNNRPSDMHPEFRMVENIFEELDSENEWYYNSKEKKLYLWPSEKTNLNASIIEASTLKHLIEIKGNIENPVEHITIENLIFEHTQRTFMEPYDPLLRSDWTIYRGGTITLDGSAHCMINNCEFTNLGGNVIFVNGYNREHTFKGNHIYNCGASAISFVGDASSVRSPSFQYGEFVPAKDMDTVKGPANELYPAKCMVENNLIYRIGRVEKQVAGVQISMAMKIHVKNNSIYDVPRAGINVSEGTWGGHIIEFNDVFNTVLETSDHGAFNSWGRDRFWHPTYHVIDSLVHANPKMPYWDAMYTTIIRNNRFRCDHGWDIDLDDGSSNYHIYNNLCLNGGIKLREGFYRTVENNIMVNNGFHPHVWFDNSNDVFKHNIMMTKHFPIRLKGWGKEVDYNVFPDSTALALAQKNNTDIHSVFGNPSFVSPKDSDFSVSENSIALNIGFKNFSMDQFGVQKPDLKLIAKQPEIPELISKLEKNSKTNTFKWLGTTLKNIETPEEQSASGLFDMNGIIVLKIEENSKLSPSNLKENDVIIGLNDDKIKNTEDFLNKYQGVSWQGQMTITVIRNQQRIKIHVNLK
ncbi:PDZ domain-containing protein [Aestuariibaculum sediminum]|uniref:Right-handed parallel beta-helix repeat-containing protein n=1 Tax=Aestuariibaculum sediminum TaxID=2770637 RepID=A0A8J6U695_9FLAO|nr:PDZ domain-containing protein [Aestuariibaculum sediminum]MBD0830610.1 right-handed parallel beta-helix repeat-containing protein [Aestuariibaculum sediminum]